MMGAAGLRKEVNAILRVLRNEPYCCEVRTSGQDHWRVTRPGHGVITVSRTPSDQRALHNIRGDVRRYLNIRV